MSPSWQSPRSWSLNVAAMAASCSASSLLLANCALYLKTNAESNLPHKRLVHLALCSSSPRTRQASCIISCQFMFFLSVTKFALRWQLYFSSMILSKTWRNIRFPKTWGDSLAFPKIWRNYEVSRTCTFMNASHSFPPVLSGWNLNTSSWYARLSSLVVTTIILISLNTVLIPCL